MADMTRCAACVNAPSADDVRDWGCPAGRPGLRLVRQAAPNGRVRALATNLDAERFDAALFGDPYHQRWRIEEAFKRLSGSNTDCTSRPSLA